MTIKELMIGDWVSYNDKMSCKITALCKDRPVFDTLLGYQDWSVPYEKLKPVPLTLEILEKNGWFPLDEYRYEGDIALAKGRNYFRLKNTTICINSVHELQHALKLCGIDKEIVL